MLDAGSVGLFVCLFFFCHSACMFLHLFLYLGGFPLNLLLHLQVKYEKYRVNTKMVMKVLAKVSLVFTLSASVCLIIGIATPSWLSSNGRYQGLWISCYYLTHSDGHRECTKLDSRPGMLVFILFCSVNYVDTVKTN